MFLLWKVNSTLLERKVPQNHQLVYSHIRTGQPVKVLKEDKKGQHSVRRNTYI